MGAEVYTDFLIPSYTLIARVREGIYTLWKVYCTGARRHLQPVEGLLHGCEKASTTCGRSIAVLREGIYNLWKVYCTGARRHLHPVEGLLHGCEKASTENVKFG